MRTVINRFESYANAENSAEGWSVIDTLKGLVQSSITRDWNTTEILTVPIITRKPSYR